MAMLQLLIMNYTWWIIGLLRVNCIFITYFWHRTRPDPPKTDNFVTQPDQTRPDPIRPMDEPTHIQFWAAADPSLSAVSLRLSKPDGRLSLLSFSAADH